MLISRMLYGGELSIRRVLVSRATLGLRFCEENGLRAEEAPVGRVKRGVLPVGLLDPFHCPFGLGGKIRRDEDIDDLGSFISILRKRKRVQTGLL